MKKEKPYPQIDEHRKHYVRTPLQITKPTKSLADITLKIGSWVGVDVLKNGYQHLLSPFEFKTESECQLACDKHNKYHGWSKEEVNDIISESMGLISK